MTDEQIWLLKYGRGWVHLIDWVDAPDEDEELGKRLSKANMLEMSDDLLAFRLKVKDEIIRV